MKQCGKNNRIQIRTVLFKVIISIAILLCARIFLSDDTNLNAAEQEQVRIYPIHYETKYNYNKRRMKERNYDDINYEEISHDDIGYEGISDSDINYKEMENNEIIVAETVPSAEDFNEECLNSFNNTLFIGDSLTVGLKLYGGLNDADYFCITGIGVNRIRTSYMTGITLDTKLESTMYGTIYIMLGINDMGINRETYLSSYSALLNHIREKQPDAVIIIQSILVVTASYTDSNPMFNNDEVRIRNNALSEMADNNDNILYLDLNNYFMDSNGNLYDNISTDGCHLSADAYSIWINALLNYTIPD